MNSAISKICRNLLLSGVVCLVLSISGQSAHPQDFADNLSPDQMEALALRDTLYYKFEEWFKRFKNRIEKLKASPDSLEKKMNLLQANFIRAGLKAEFTHVLGFSSNYRIKEVDDDFIRYSNIAKKMAEELLDREDLDGKQRAAAYFYLGASEGYLGIFQYGAGSFLSALINGWSADNHLEKALEMDPDLAAAHLGLGIYRYGSSRLGGFGNFILQGGRDLRLEGLRHVERSLKTENASRPLAMKTLIWFYISEQLNPMNKNLPQDDPLSPAKCRTRTLELLDEYELTYFKNPPDKNFIGNKGLSMLKAIQFSLDGKYRPAREEFEKVLRIASHLEQTKGYPINPQLADTVKEAIKFCDLMLMQPGMEMKAANISSCSKVNDQIEFIENGGSMVQYNSQKIRKDIQDVFYNRLKDLSRQLKC